MKICYPQKTEFASWWMSGECNLLCSVSSQQKFEAMDVKALSVSQLSDGPCYSSQLSDRLCDSSQPPDRPCYSSRTDQGYCSVLQLSFT